MHTTHTLKQLYRLVVENKTALLDITSDLFVKN